MNKIDAVVLRYTRKINRKYKFSKKLKWLILQIFENLFYTFLHFILLILPWRYLLFSNSLAQMAKSLKRH
jgi:hypothetical protein